MNRITITGSNLGLSEQRDSEGRWIGVEVSSESPLVTSDGYHTIDELYDHRITLFITLCRLGSDMDNPPETQLDVWRSKTHSDGTPAYEGWFVLGIGKKEGSIITYHIPLSHWEETNFAEEIERAHFDGHTSADVLERLKTL